MDLLIGILKIIAGFCLVVFAACAVFFLLPILILFLLIYTLFLRRNFRTDFERFRHPRAPRERTVPADSDVVDADFRVIDDGTDGRPSGD